MTPSTTVMMLALKDRPSANTPNGTPVFNISCQDRGCRRSRVRLMAFARIAQMKPPIWATNATNEAPSKCEESCSQPQKYQAHGHRQQAAENVCYRDDIEALMRFQHPGERNLPSRKDVGQRRR